MRKEPIVDWKLYEKIRESASAKVHVTIRPNGKPIWDEECAGLGFDGFTYTVTAIGEGADNSDVAAAHDKLQEFQDQYSVVTTRF